MADHDTETREELRCEAHALFRKHILNLLINMEVDVKFLVFLYSFRDGEHDVLDKMHMQDFASEHYTSRSKQKYDLLMHLYGKGYDGLKALVQALVFTGQKYLADEVHLGISQAFWSRRNQHYPRF